MGSVGSEKPKALPSRAHLGLCHLENRRPDSSDDGWARRGLEASKWEGKELSFCDLLLLCISLLNTFLLLIPGGCQLVNGFLEKASEKVLDPASSDFTR